ncbi:MAG: hypothetical protein M3414_09125, partial [Pseudomonadota bacterium]|nr:hypothetical protein [Pseudomonadota bacterium]
RVGNSRQRLRTRELVPLQRGAFLWLLSLAPSKKVTRLQAEALDVVFSPWLAEVNFKITINFKFKFKFKCFRPEGRVHFFW